ncbi:enoyl-CoA hydratase [Micrococcaceae bacterium Sec5.7]
MTYEYIRYEVDGPVATIWQNRPQQRNAQNEQMLDELNDAILHAGQDTEVRAVVLTGAGGHFSAGHDLKEGQMKRQDFTPEERWDFESRFYMEYCLNIFNLPKPTIARVDGACIAGAFMVANMCDMIVASEDAFFADPVLHTMAVGAVEVLVHPWVMGSRKAREFLFTGERMSAREALECGMVNRVVPAAELDTAVDALARRVAQAPPFATRVLKKSLNRTLEAQGFHVALSAHFDAHQLTHFSAEAARGKADGGFSNSITRHKTGASVK